jgi:hypothetical protein
MTQICPCTLYAIAVVLGFAVYVIAIVAVYIKNRKASKPAAVLETKEKPEAPQSSNIPKKAMASSQDSNSAILKEINEKLSNIDAIAKFTKARSIADKLAESQEKAEETDSVRAKISQTVKTLKSSESPQPDESEFETVAERTEELA